MMAVAISGSHGLIGSALHAACAARGMRSLRLVRRTVSGPDEVSWDPASGRIEAAALEGLDAVIHLAGESLSAGRWTPARKARIQDSRVSGTRFLAETLSGLGRPPRVFVSASAAGYYGSRGSEILSEDSDAGSGFLADLCRDWEAATDPARHAGIRVCQTRFGVVLSPRGGMLGKMLPVFRAGLGGRLGNGRQYISWITIDDLVDAIFHLLGTDAPSGPVNVVAPRPVTNAEFTAALGRALSRPAIFPVPAAALRVLFGEMADEALLASGRVIPERLEASGFAFRFPEIDPALLHVLRRSPGRA